MILTALRYAFIGALLTAVAFLGSSLVAATASAQTYVPSYEAPWSTPAQYEYQYTTPEGIIPPSMSDFLPVDSVYPTNYSYGYDTDYSTGYDTYDGGYTYADQTFDYGNTYAYGNAQPAAAYYTVPTYYTVGDASSDISRAQVLQCAPGDSRWRADEVGGSSYYVDGSSSNSSSATVTNTVKPACRLTPKSTNTNTVILEWVTNNATTAFIDNGIGHVSLGTGGRMVTPTQSTVYTMTVVNERGASAQCAANIVVQGTAPVSAQTVVVNQQGVPVVGQATTSEGAQQSGTQTTPTVQYDANGNQIVTATDEAQKVGNNILGSITGTLSSGQSIWERIRLVSMIALGIFIVLSVVVFVMKKVFGGGGEGGH